VFVPPCVFNATKKCDHCNEKVATPASDMSVRFIAILDLFKSARSHASGEKGGSIDLKCHLDPAVFVLPCVFNATENCADCYEGLTASTDKMNNSFIALLDLFERAQSHASGEKRGFIDLKCHLDLRGVRASMCVQRDGEMRSL